MSDKFAVNKQIWIREKERFGALVSLLDDVQDMRTLEWLIDSADDRIRTLWCVRKEEVHRTMYIFMLAKMKREIHDLHVQLRMLKGEVEELKKGISLTSGL